MGAEIQVGVKIFVAGAAGAMGKALLPLLTKAGYTTTGMTRSAANAGRIRTMGATPVIADALDPEEVRTAVMNAAPDVIVHQLTSIPAAINLRHIDRDFALTNRLRIEGLDNLIAAAKAVGCRRMVAQSYTGWPYARIGGPVKSEGDPLDPEPPAKLKETLQSIRYLEQVTTGTPGIDGTVLRYGAFYGPGNTLGPGGPFLDEVRKRRVPVIGRGTGIWSFIHIDDAASATQCAIEKNVTGIFNIVDDDPAPVSEWLPALAKAIGAPRPRQIPAWVARLLIGEHAVSMMTQIRGARNSKARGELGWAPAWSSWREGFAHGLAATLQ